MDNPIKASLEELNVLRVRCTELAQLCRDMYSYVDVAETHILLMTKGTCKEFHDRMEQLGLLEGDDK